MALHGPQAGSHAADSLPASEDERGGYPDAFMDPDSEYASDSDLDSDSDVDEEAMIESDDNSDYDGDSDSSSGEEHPRKLEHYLWTSLEHHGVFFPPEYRPHRRLPQGVKLLYAGEPVDLPLEAEEIAYAFARRRANAAKEGPHFVPNFFADLNAALIREDRPPLQDFAQCDFSRMREHAGKHGLLQARRLPVKAKQARERHKWCWVDGEMCPVSSFELDPPGIFIGASPENSNNGRFLPRVRPEEITLNISPGLEQAVKPPYGQWKAVVSDRTKPWLAEYIHPIHGLRRVTVSGHKKWEGLQYQYEAAHELGGYLWRVRADYRKDLRSTSSMRRQDATIMWLVDLLGLRLARTRTSEFKGDHDFGFRSLRCRDVNLFEPNELQISFTGPHGLVYSKRVIAPPLVLANLQYFLKGKQPDDALFSKLNLDRVRNRCRRYRLMLGPSYFRAFNFSRALQLAMDEYEATILFKYVSHVRRDRVEVFHQLVRKIAGLVKLIPSVPADNDDKNPLIELHKWALFRLKMKMNVLNPAFVVGETMDAQEYKRLGLKYIQELEPWNRQNYELEIEQEVATGAVQLDHNITIPNDPAYVWDLLCDRMLLIDIERMRIIDPSFSGRTKYESFIDPRIIVAYGKRHNIPLHHLMLNTVRTKWASSAPPNFRY